MRTMMRCAVVGILLSSTLLFAQTSAPTEVRIAGAAISLPAPAKSGGMTLNEALATRRSVREYAGTKLTLQETSQLLWAAQGITDDKGHRTAPSAHAQYFLHVYVANADGVFEYLPKSHEMQPISTKDARANLSSQGTVKAAPTVFIIAGEYDRAVGKSDAAMGHRFVDLEAGHAAQNMLLTAAAMKLGAVPAGGFDPKQVSSAAGLPATITPIYLVPVGHLK